MVWVDGADGRAGTIPKVDVCSDVGCGAGAGADVGADVGADAGADAGAFFEPFTFFFPRAILHFQMLVFYCFACFALLCFVLCWFDFACVWLFSEEGGCEEGCELRIRKEEGAMKDHRPECTFVVRM